MRASSWVAIVLLLVLVPTKASSQASTRPFDRLDVGIYGAANVNRNQFHTYWDAGPAGTIDFVTPFYAGRASLMLRVGHNDPVPDEATSGFMSVFVALGWRAGRYLLVRDLRGDVGLHVGVTNWNFSEETESSVRNELELGTEGSVRADYEFATRWHAIVEASYQFTFTYERIELAYVSIGLARTFGAPGWMRGVLQ